MSVVIRNSLVVLLSTVVAVALVGASLSMSAAGARTSDVDMPVAQAEALLNEARDIADEQEWMTFCSSGLGASVDRVESGGQVGYLSTNADAPRVAACLTASPFEEQNFAALTQSDDAFADCLSRHGFYQDGSDSAQTAESQGLRPYAGGVMVIGDVEELNLTPDAQRRLEMQLAAQQECSR